MAKLKDGFYKLTASSIGSDLLVLLAGGGAKPISDFAEASALDNYLPLSGGILTSSGNPLIIKRTDDSGPGLVFYSKETQLGSIGISTDYVPKFYNANVGILYTMWHNGNDGSGSGLDADLLDGYHMKNWDGIPAVLSNGVMDIGKYIDFHNAVGDALDYATRLECSGAYSNWVYLPSKTGTLALTIDNVASATKLQTARTIWGQSFDGSGDISGSIDNCNWIRYYKGGSVSGYIVGRGEEITGGDGLGLWTYGNTPIFLGTGSMQRMTIDSSGNVGIGTTSPSSKLHVYSTDNTTIRIQSDGSGGDQGAICMKKASGNGLVFAVENRDFIWQVGSSSLSGDGTERMRLTNSGNVGIGTTSPSEKLQISGGVFLQEVKNQWITPARVQIGRKDTTVYSDRSCVGTTDGNLHLDAYKGKMIYLNYYQQPGTYGLASTAVIIDAAGNTGIGVPPSYKLHVAGTIYSTGAVYANNFYGYLNGNISGSAASAGYTTRLYANSTTNLTTYPGDYSLAYSRFQADASNIFPCGNNANGVITAHLHAGEYYAQIGLSSNGRMYYRTMLALTLSSGVGWNLVAWSGESYTKSESDSRFINASGDTMTGTLYIGDSKHYLQYYTGGKYVELYNVTAATGIGVWDTGEAKVFNSNGLYKIWHEGNDGSGSGLDADLLDGYHEYSFLRYRDLGSNGGATLWNQIGIRSYHNALPEGLSGLYKYGQVVSLPGNGSRLDIFTNHVGSSQSSGQGGLWWRSGWDDDKHTWRRIIDSGNIGSQSVNYASSAGNADTVDNLHASAFVRAYGTYGTSYSYDSDWGLSIVTFDPIVSGTAPAQNPNISILNIGDAYYRRKQLAFTYSTNDIYYRRRVDSSWSGWVRLAIAGESYTKGDSDGRYYPISGNVNMSGDNKWIGSTMGGGTDYWRIGGSGTSDNGVCQITIGDNSNDYFQIVIADYSGTNYTALLVKAGGTYAPHFYESSDQRLKTNIQAILNKGNIPQIKEFDWKEDGSHSYGLIAQELEEQGYSELVSTKDDGYKTVNYSAALSLIVGKLQVKIKELEKEIEILKNKN